MLTDVSNKVNPSKAKQLGFSESQLEDMYKTKAFQWVLQYEDPGKAVADALSSPKPSLALNALQDRCKCGYGGIGLYKKTSFIWIKVRHHK